MRRLTTLILSVLGALAGLVLVAGPASAHHSDVSGSIACGTTPGTWEVTWRVHNWNGGSAANVGTVVSATRAAVPAGTVFADNQTRTFTETVTTDAALTLRVTMRWQNGSESTDSATVYAFPTCEQAVTPTAPSVTPPTCDTAGTLVVPGNTAAVTYAVSPTYDGPGTYTVTATATPGHVIDGTSTWTLTVEPASTGEECWEVVTPVAPTVTAVAGCDTQGAVVLPTTEGVDYRLVEGDGTTGAWTVVATALPGYSIAAGATTEWSGDLGTPRVCVTPVEPTVVPADCGTGEQVELPTTEGVVYEATPGAAGTVTVTATAEPGHELVGTSEWVIELADAKDCVGGIVEPGPAPTVTTSTPTASVPTVDALPATGASRGQVVGALMSVLLVAAGLALVLPRRQRA